MKSMLKRLTPLAVVAVLFTTFAVDAAFARWVIIRYSDGSVRRIWVDEERLPGLNWGHQFSGEPYRTGLQRKSDAGQLQMKAAPQLKVGDDLPTARRKRPRRVPIRRID